MSTERARQLRQDSTWAEKQLWRLLRARRLAGYKFRRQRFERRYYLDLYCCEAKLGVELDGGGHGHPDQQRHDRERDAFLAARGIVVKRIWNHQLARAEGRQNLVENLWCLLQERAPHPGNIVPPPYRREPDKPDEPSPWPPDSSQEGNCFRTRAGLLPSLEGWGVGLSAPLLGGAGGGSFDWSYLEIYIGAMHLIPLETAKHNLKVELQQTHRVAAVGVHPSSVAVAARSHKPAGGLRRVDALACPVPKGNQVHSPDGSKLLPSSSRHLPSSLILVN